MDPVQVKSRTAIVALVVLEAELDELLEQRSRFPTAVVDERIDTTESAIADLCDALGLDLHGNGPTAGVLTSLQRSVLRAGRRSMRRVAYGR